MSITVQPVMDEIDHQEYAWIWDTTWPWTHEQIRLFSHLPVDITRLIFEKAMEYRPRPLQLLLVSHRVCCWLEPLIYEHVTLYTDQAFDQFYATFRARLHSSTTRHCSSFLQRHVRTLFISPDYPGQTRLTDVVRHLTGLRSLACWDGQPTQWGKTAMSAVIKMVEEHDSETDFPYSHLRRVSFGASLLIEREITFAHRAFRYLTHIDILVSPAANWESLNSLDNLTHISLDMVTDMPSLSSKALNSWFSRFAAAFPPSLKVAILAVVQCYNTNFDLSDSEGNFFYPGWPPSEAMSATSVNEIDCNPWLKSRAKDHVDVDVETLHPITQLALGKIDLRAVPAAVACDLPINQICRDLLVYFNWPDNRLDWDGTAHGHRDCWSVAEDLIERRKTLTWADLVARLPL